MTTHHTALDLAASFTIAGIHTCATLWERLPILAAACTPFGRHYGAELHLMVDEKMAALVEGIADAQHELSRLTVAAITGRLDFEAMPHVSASVAAAGMRSAFATVKANSRRLSRR